MWQYFSGSNFFPTNTNGSRFRPLFLQLLTPPPSIALPLIFSVANKYLFSFSFNKYLYKSMARIQPPFLHFYLFQPRQHNISFLLTSKEELKYPGVLFLSNSNQLLCLLLFPLPLGLSSFSFSIVNEVTFFIYLFGQLYFSLKNNSKPSP